MVHSPILRHCVENQAAHSVTSPKKLKTKTALFRYKRRKKIPLKVLQKSSEGHQV